MPLNAGTRLGSYEILSPIGAGGMGEVYRARDTKLNRDVAIKILPELFAQDAERLARFEREARALAALNHPNIAQIYGLESGALVMELVEGEDLSQRLTRGAMPIAEALAIARQVAEALEAAHEQGIVHRDLKPANIKVREDGAVKVLDFGLAKALSPDASRPGSEVMNSPTLTARATQMGTVLGTAAYMAPEQARGKSVDRRADVWAFGVVLYEMLTGRRAFEGDDVSDVLAAVLRHELDWSALPPDTPEPVRRLLRRCLERDRRERLADMSAVRIEIRDAMSASASAVPTPATAAPHRPSLSFVAGAVALAVLAGIGAWRLKPDPVPPAPRVTRFSVPLPQGSDWTRAGRHVIAISPDGARVAYIADGKLFVRGLDQLDATHISSVADPAEPFFSPDGQWIGFFAGGSLQKVAISGGAPVPITAAALPMGASWAGDFIVFGHDDGIMRVPATGGTPELAVPVKGEERLANPSLVQSGRFMLFTRAQRDSTASMQWDDAEIVLEDLSTHERRVLIRGGTDARWLEPNYLVYARRGELLAIAVDARTLEPRGTPVMLVGEVARALGGATGSQQFSLASEGTLVYVRGRADDLYQLAWMPIGSAEATELEIGRYLYPRPSPRDGSRIAFADGLTGETDIFVLEWARKAKVRVTTSPATDTSPVWTPDGTRLAFSSSRDGPLNMYWQPADGTGVAERLTTSPNAQYPYAFAPDGQTLVFSELNPTTTFDIYALPIAGDRQPRALVATNFDERRPALSPDGRWIAYQSDELGSFEVHVRPFPDVDSARHLVSAGGGASPLWAPDGRSIYYRNRGRVFRVGVSTSPQFEAGIPEQVLDGLPVADAVGMSYDLAPDGERFIVVKPIAAGNEAVEYRVIVNWIQEVKARVGR